MAFLNPLTAFVSPLTIRLGLAVAVLAALGWGLHLIRKDAAEDVRRVVERANREAEAKADAGGLSAATCPPELWSRERQQCATKLH